MSVRRALVDCAVLSLQDATVLYPCCRGCFSRISVEQQDTTRCRCSKCGYSCPREQVDHRYRLSLKVARDTCIFGVTVFGTCLNPFFGIHASGLQRLVENVEGPVGASTRSTLLLKAVKDCFIGRHFVFGIKVSETEGRPWLGEPVGNNSSSKESAQFIASQMILPTATGLEGCTVVSYYQSLLQKAADFELGSTDPNKTPRHPARTLLLLPCHSPASSFNNTRLSASALLSQSLQRSQYQDGTLTPTPPWQQSLGLITSSAEQEEGCSMQDSGDEISRHQTDINKTPHRAQGDRLESHEVTEETLWSPLTSLECTSYSSPSLAKYLHSPTEKADGSTPILKSWSSPSPPGHLVKRLSTRRLTQTFLSSPEAWEDLPFSESLTEFLHEENKDFEIASETEPLFNVQNQNENARNNLEIRSQGKNSSIESSSVCQSNTQATNRHSKSCLLDITNTPALHEGDRRDLSEQVCKSLAGCVNKSHTRSTGSPECEQENEKASLLSFINEEQLEVDTYNCSADLFSNSLAIDTNINALNVHGETVRTTTEACSLLSKPDSQHPRSEKSNVQHSTPDKQKLKCNKCINRESLILPGMQDLDFIPPSQSTPIVNVAVVSGSVVTSYRTSTSGEFSSQPDKRDSCASYGNVSELNSKEPARITSSLCEVNCVGAIQQSQCGRESKKENRGVISRRRSRRFTPKRRFWKPDRHRNHLLAPRHLRIQGESLNTGSTGRINHKCDSSDCDATACDYEDDEVAIVPPTPAARTRHRVRLRRRQTDDCSSNMGCTWEGKQGDGVNRERTITSSQRVLLQTGHCDSEAADEGHLDGSNCHYPDDDNEECNWSRDLFSDSV